MLSEQTPENLTRQAKLARKRAYARAVSDRLEQSIQNASRQAALFWEQRNKDKNKDKDK